MRLCEGKFGYLQGVVFMQNFWNFKVIPRTEIILTSIQSRTHSDKIQVIPMERFLEMMENFCFYFDEKVKNIK
jgi:BioD-like phosphotransacetylase family protein